MFPREGKGALETSYTNPRIQNSFNISMDPESHDLAALSTCTTCQFTEDLSNYWTAVLFFRSKNGTFKRVPQIAQSGMEGTQGGMVRDVFSFARSRLPFIVVRLTNTRVLSYRSSTTCPTRSSTPPSEPT